MQLAPLQIAIIDMYDGSPNIGMRCIHTIINKWSKDKQLTIELTTFRLRNHGEIPNDTFDIYISTGGPGSPTATVNEDWDIAYTRWLEKMIAVQKPVFLICHSFMESNFYT